MKKYPNLNLAIRGAGMTLLNTGTKIQPKTWQRVESPEMFEALFVNLMAPIPYNKARLVEETQPNLPWAEEHFQERVSGIPYNPPPSHERWPFGSKLNARFREGENFSHTYPERIWPKHAGDEDGMMKGIRFYAGDLRDVIDLLNKEPDTRQAYLPIWFPEDTGVVHGKRVPCTLGYHFINRGNNLHLTYYIRSCDYFRHFNDDVFMACRLAQWVLEQLQSGFHAEYWKGVAPGWFRMDIVNLHIFAPEVNRLEKTLNEWKVV